MKLWARREGFTIVELLIVVIVIAILAAIVLVAYNGITKQADESSAQAGASQAGKKAEAYKITNGDKYPDDVDELGITDNKITYIQYDNGDGFCASSISGAASYYVSHIQSTPTPGVCEGGLVGGSACPAGYLPVPGDKRFGTNDFCLMKYEAKNIGGVATSQPGGTPWVNTTQVDAISIAADACDGCHLVTEAEWMTVAANVLSVPGNWGGGSVGSGYIYSGHNDNVPASSLVASSNDSNGYTGTGNSSGNQRRTLRLTNGSTMWDLAGNVYEWTNATMAGNQQPGIPGESDFAWKEWGNTSIVWNALPTLSRPSAISVTVGGYTSARGIGQLFSSYGESDTRAFMRGGVWDDLSGAGVLALNLNREPWPSYGSSGFRVAR